MRTPWPYQLVFGKQGNWMSLKNEDFSAISNKQAYYYMTCL